MNESPFERPAAADEAAHSGDAIKENVAKLKALFPEIVTDGRIDFDVLRQLLGDEVEEGEERYGLNWKGKAAARAFALTPSLGTLRPAREDSVDWETTQNIVIEGDNLEALKILRRSYAGKVKLIYIDPPYNTGNDFVYPDDYRDSLGNYERLTGQRGADGVALTTNREASGRFHTDWLNMMYPRLLIARDLLSKEGAIFISISDIEHSQLRQICDQIFGSENFVASVIWEKVHTRKNSSRYFSVSHDFILIFASSKQDWPRPLFPRETTDAYSNPDNHPKGPWKLDPITAHNPYNADYTITKPNGIVLKRPAGRYWAFSEQTIMKKIEDNEIVWGDGEAYPMVKRFLCEVQDGMVPTTIFDRNFAGDSARAKRETDDIFGKQSVYEYPKPVQLIQRMLQIATDSSAIVLDFFAGSGTTGHAVMAQNAGDDGNRRYILVQLPEPLDPTNSSQKTAADFCDQLGKPRTIAEVMKERLRRAGRKLKAEHPEKPLDTGFRVYKLATSNLRPWQPGSESLEQQLLDAVDNILPDRSEDDLLTELLLKTGIDLTLPTECREIAGKTVHALGGGTLIVCLAEDVSDDEAEPLALGIAQWRHELDPPGATAFWFRDSGFASAAAKANVVAILKQRIPPAAITRIAAV